LDAGIKSSTQLGFGSSGFNTHCNVAVYGLGDIRVFGGLQSLSESKSVDFLETSPSFSLTSGEMLLGPVINRLVGPLLEYFISEESELSVEIWRLKRKFAGSCSGNGWELAVEASVAGCRVAFSEIAT
jgi:hypothetical protein